MNEPTHFDPEAGRTERRGHVTHIYAAPACGADVSFRRVRDGLSEIWPPCTRDGRHVTCQRCRETDAYRAAVAEPEEEGRRGKVLGGVIFPPCRRIADLIPSAER